MISEEILLHTTESLSTPLSGEKKMMPCSGAGQFPAVPRLEDFMDCIQKVIFPDFFDKQRSSNQLRSYFIGVNLERMKSLLDCEIASALRFNNICCRDEAESRAEDLSLKFINTLPHIKALIFTDVEAVFNNDPATVDYAEVILCYPAIRALIHYRVAHSLLTLGVPVLPRMLTELAHSATGIDINPGAQIGEYFAIDHGTGIVIGQTCIIGKHCTLYQGVTLGAKNFVVDEGGRPVDVPRHPILEDNVTVYSNATILGRITVGHDSIIGGNVWLTHSVPSRSRVVPGRKAVDINFIDGAGI